MRLIKIAVNKQKMLKWRFVIEILEAVKHKLYEIDRKMCYVYRETYFTPKNLYKCLL